MQSKKPIALSFSGKDSVLALHKLTHEYIDKYEVKTFISTINKDYNRSSMHGTRVELLEAQAKKLGFALKKIYIPKDCSNKIYSNIMKQACEELKADGIYNIAFGDIFLESVKNYRQDMLKQAGMQAIFPLWGIPTADIMDEFLSLGYKTIITCIDLIKLPEEFSGSFITRDLLKKLPKNVDICGEYGEYHSFVYDGPMFGSAIKFKTGEKKLVDDIYTKEARFLYTDIY